MMSISPRRQKIEALLADDPTDAFLRYSLAMELDKAQEHEQSLVQFRSLMADAPPYVPAFFMAAQQLARLGRTPEARDALRDGIERARAAGDTHAAGEMSEFLISLGAEGE
jgi:thioredoxin-like negative regulator of GroEL